jgi:hypothetical protein
LVFLLRDVDQGSEEFLGDRPHHVLRPHRWSPWLSIEVKGSLRTTFSLTWDDIFRCWLQPSRLIPLDTDL